MQKKLTGFISLAFVAAFIVIGAGASGVLEIPVSSDGSFTVGSVSPDAVTWGTITYWKGHQGGGVTGHTLGAGNTITIDTNSVLVFRIPARFTSSSTAKGYLQVYNSEEGRVTNTILLTPGVTGTLVTNPGLRWTTPGTKYVSLEVWPSSGLATARIVTVNVI
ncbi:MAG: hypothetical protein LUQ25_08120 [Methanoregulaceae archaeon]|nr:hypothetical protein [Methanoregulaceae archaeon]